MRLPLPPIPLSPRADVQVVTLLFTIGHNSWLPCVPEIHSIVPLGGVAVWRGGAWRCVAVRGGARPGPARGRARQGLRERPS